MNARAREESSSALGYKANVRAIAVGIGEQLVTGAPRTRANKNYSDEANVRASGDGAMEPTNSLL